MANDQPSVEERSRYEALRKEIAAGLTRKRNIDKQLAQTEQALYDLESTYLTETATHSGGNIIQGFDGYLKNQSVGRRKYEVLETDRMFSNSSATYKKSLDMLGDGDEIVEDVKPISASRATVILPASNSAEQKKNRDREYQRRKRANMARRSTGTISDEEGSQVSTGTVTPISSRQRKRLRTGDD